MPSQCCECSTQFWNYCPLPSQCHPLPFLLYLYLATFISFTQHTALKSHIPHSRVFHPNAVLYHPHLPFVPTTYTCIVYGRDNRFIIYKIELFLPPKSHNDFLHIHMYNIVIDCRVLVYTKRICLGHLWKFPVDMQYDTKDSHFKFIS